MRWQSLIHWPLLPAALASQVPFTMPPSHTSQQDYAFNEAKDVFSPRNLIELARPGSGVANPAGDLFFVPVSKYSFKDKKTLNVIHIFPLNTTASQAEALGLENGDSLESGEAFWLDSRTLGHVVPGGKDNKIQELFAVSLKYETGSVALAHPPVSITRFPTSGLGHFKYSPKASTLVFSAHVWPDMNLSTVNEQDKAWENRGTSALVYDQTYVRHWDKWVGPKKRTLFSAGLGAINGTWTLKEDYVAPLSGSGHETPVEPFGGKNNFDVSATHILYTAKDPTIPESLHTRQNVYIVPIAGGEKPRHLTTGKQGATDSPVFNMAGTLAAWTEMDTDGYEADRAKIVVYDLVKNVRFTLTPEWDRSASQLSFSAAGDTIIFTASEDARVKIFRVPIPPTPSSSDAQISSLPLPIPIYEAHSSSSVQPLLNGDILFTRSSLTSYNHVFLLSGVDTSDSVQSVKQITRFSEDDLEGKSLDEGEDFWFKGADGFNVHGWILKPKGWKEGGAGARKAKTWPVVLLIHGGPQGSWEDSWSTRWNPNVFAQQGYFVIFINPTGSTGFGQEFTDRITENWGGRPFVDLRKGWDAALELYPEIDPNRAVAAGASWGGYAINWIEGHPEFGFGFKALVNHDGVFDTKYNGFSTDELFFFNHDFGGPPFTKAGREIAERWNPSNFVHKWTTPVLLFHGSRDYRLPQTEGISAFNALQQLGVDSRLVVFPDENHWVLKPENSLKWHYEVFRWFDKYVGGGGQIDR